jgi:cyanophycinase
MIRLTFLFVLTGIITETSGQTAGPTSGSLVIVGGAMKDTAIVNRFISLAGGPDASIVLIPTASGEQNIDNKTAARVLTDAGARNVTVLHTYDPKVANTEAFVTPLRKASGVWFNGGRQWRFVDAYGGTLTETEIQKVLERGGVIGGSSAGATIQGSYLVRGDTKTNTLVMGDHIRGFAYLRNSAIDQHLLVRNREHDLIEVISKYPELLGIGLDENTAVVVKGDLMEVIGQSYVAIYDHKLWPGSQNEKGKIPNGGRYFFLRKGDVYNLRTREVVKWSGDPTRNIF